MYRVKVMVSGSCVLEFGFETGNQAQAMANLLQDGLIGINRAARSSGSWMTNRFFINDYTTEPFHNVATILVLMPNE